MYLLSAPLALDTVHEQSYPAYLEQLRDCGVKRVFLCGLGEIATGEGAIYTDPERIGRWVSRFRQDGFEVGLWVNSFGHGMLLSHSEGECRNSLGFSAIVGLDGRSSEKGLCPTDPAFRDHFAKSLQIVAAQHPDLIMLDDDFRLNVRDTNYDIGCFCRRHLEAFYREIGEEIPRDQLREKLFVGGKNPYRSAFLRTQGRSMVQFAKEMRAAVDAVDPNVRLSCCICFDTWDMDGTDGVELARAFAGNTKPFLRTIGAPYHDIRVGAAVESTRMQARWCTENGIEVFAEGDVYPRPRYNVPTAPLELFDLALLATGELDGILKYMFDYNRPANYERGYVARHMKNAALRQGIAEIFGGKSTVGVHVLEAMHKVEQWELPAELPTPVGRYLSKGFHSRAGRMLSQLAVPTVHRNTGYPVAVFGENARHVQEEELQNGALLDAAAAQILTDRGFDVGLIESRAAKATSEYFPEADDKIPGIADVPIRAMTVAKEAVVKSLLMPDSLPGAYTYENAKGQRFFVLACDPYAALPTLNKNYFNNYYRQTQLRQGLKWAAGRPLPATCPDGPFLYLLAAKGEDGHLAVLVLNIFEDEALTPRILLDRPARVRRFVGCTGEAEGNCVTLSDIPAFSAVAFEVE